MPNKANLSVYLQPRMTHDERDDFATLRLTLLVHVTCNLTCKTFRQAYIVYIHWPTPTCTEAAEPAPSHSTKHFPMVKPLTLVDRQIVASPAAAAAAVAAAGSRCCSLQPNQPAEGLCLPFGPDACSRRISVPCRPASARLRPRSPAPHPHALHTANMQENPRASPWRALPVWHPHTLHGPSLSSSNLQIAHIDVQQLCLTQKTMKSGH